MPRECDKYEITIEKLLNVVHSYTDPIRICVVMDDAWLACPEAKRMHDFYLTRRVSKYDDAETERLLKYYKDVPVWNLHVWMDADNIYREGRCIRTGIQANCHYKDIRDGYLAEKAEIAREKRREYRKRRKVEQCQTGSKEQ